LSTQESCNAAANHKHETYSTQKSEIFPLLSQLEKLNSEIRKFNQPNIKKFESLHAKNHRHFLLSIFIYKKEVQFQRDLFKLTQLSGWMVKSFRLLPAQLREQFSITKYE
jgi:hypothetical protein